DGVYRHLLVRAAPVVGPEGCIREWIGATTDITERRQEELERARLIRELSREQRLLEAVLRHIPAGMIRLERPSEHVRIGDGRFNEMFSVDLSPGQCLRDSIRELGIFSADGTPRRMEDGPMYKALFLGEAVEDVETIIERADGSRVVVSASS